MIYFFSDGCATYSSYEVFKLVEYGQFFLLRFGAV